VKESLNSPAGNSKAAFHGTGTKSNQDENRNFQACSHETGTKIINFQYIPLAAISFFYNAFVNMYSCETKSTAKTGLKYICVYIHPAPNSSRSEDSPFSPVHEQDQTSDRFEQLKSFSRFLCVTVPHLRLTTICMAKITYIVIVMHNLKAKYLVI
jgi:hypothetical protein